MDVLVGLLGLSLAASGLLLGRSHHRHAIERLRQQARLTAIEAQLAALRTTLRLQGAEHAIRRRMQAEARRDVFANPTIYQEPDEWR